tara:strand:+ start:121 stop:375 length:255 start_codon:yes stop_codon:yes gene_type:complete
MTEYTKKVEKERARLKQAEELKQWALGVKYIHLNNGIMETAFNNGDIEYSQSGKIWWHKEKLPKKTLFDRFQRAMSDMIRPDNE